MKSGQNRQWLLKGKSPLFAVSREWRARDVDRTGASLTHQGVVSRRRPNPLKLYSTRGPAHTPLALHYVDVILRDTLTGGESCVSKASHTRASWTSPNCVSPRRRSSARRYRCWLPAAC